jgi:ankyrin repeat protein
MFTVLVGTMTAGSLNTNTQADPLTQLRLLLKARAEPNVVDHRGQTPLHVAASKGNAGAVAALLNGGARPFTQDMFGSTPLLEACRMGQDSVITLMVQQRGLKFEQGDRAVANALCLAVADGDMKQVGACRCVVWLFSWAWGLLQICWK